MKEWYTLNLKVDKFSADQPESGLVKLTSNYSLINGKASCQVVYTVNGAGELKVDYSLNPSLDLPNIPKVGMQCGIQRSYD